MALASLLGLAAVCAAPPEAAARKTVFEAQLDGDRPLERVRIETVGCRDTFPCSRLVLSDGTRRVNLTRISQRPRFPYHWYVREVLFRDLTGDGRPEIVWDLFTVGGTGSSPSLIGVHRWDGERATRVFAFGNGRRPPAGWYFNAYVRWRLVTGANGRVEIETSESLHRRDDGTCCPSAFRLVRHRWNGGRIAPVPGSVRIRRVARRGKASSPESPNNSLTRGGSSSIPVPDGD